MSLIYLKQKKFKFMPKTSRTQSEAKLQAALNAMRETFSTTEFRPWNSQAIVKMYRIGGAFPTVLNRIGAIETNYGSVRLTPRMEGLKASTVRKHINEYTNKNRKKFKTTKFKEQPVLPFPKSAISFDNLVIALKEKMRKELMDELYQSLK